MNRPRIARLAALTLMSCAVVVGSALADVAAGTYLSTNPVSKTASFQIQGSTQQYKLTGKTEVTINGKSVPVKALAKVTPGTPAKVFHKGGVASKIAILKAVAKKKSGAAPLPKKKANSKGAFNR